MDDIKILARKYLQNHKNPIKRFEVLGQKLFIPNGTEGEVEVVKRGLDSIKCVLDHERVERRCARIRAQWLPKQKQAKLNKGGKIVKSYGFANKLGRFLHPEEALLLLETNRIELFLENIPISIQEAYNILVTTNRELNKYVAYRKLCLQGFRLLPSLMSINEKDTEHSPAKKRCLGNNEAENVCKVDTSLEKQLSPEFSDIFKKLQQNGPKPYTEFSTAEESEYKVFTPENSSRTVCDFKLVLSDVQQLDPKLCFMNTSFPTIVNFASHEFSGYFQIAHVNIPTLL